MQYMFKCGDHRTRQLLNCPSSKVHSDDVMKAFMQRMKCYGENVEYFLNLQKITRGQLN